MSKSDDSAWGRTVKRVKQHPAVYDGEYRLNGRDAVGVFTTGGATAFVLWIVNDLIGIPIPHGAAGFLGALLGLACARFFKPGR